MPEIVLSMILSLFLASWVPGTAIDKYNQRFMASVDAAGGDSCWERVGGEVGIYGDAENYMLNVGCLWDKYKP